MVAPQPMVEGYGSAQFPKYQHHPDAMGARAAIVADNIKDLFLENVWIRWPESNATPFAWSHPERIENGSLRIHRMDYSRARQTEFSVLWERNLLGGRVNLPDAQPSDVNWVKYHIRHSNIRIT